MNRIIRVIIDAVIRVFTKKAVKQGIRSTRSTSRRRHENTENQRPEQPDSGSYDAGQDTT